MYSSIYVVKEWQLIDIKWNANVDLFHYLQCIQVFWLCNNISCDVDTFDSVEHNEVDTFHILVCQLVEKKMTTLSQTE